MHRTFDLRLFITRRCTQREFVLRSDDKINQVLTFCLGHAAKATGPASDRTPSPLAGR